ncbi:MAG: 23S rRNA (guanosine(2251)-2'-O)-methyltransferase RlmB [Bacteroidota bacterium]
MSDELGYIYGKNSIREALRSQPEKISKIYVLYDIQSKEIFSIIANARKHKIPCVQLDKNKFNALEKRICPEGSRSQGIIALQELVESLTLGELIDKINKTENPILLILDGITDPHNLGAIARAAECAGAKGIILPERKAATITPVAIKSSAGALQHLPVAYVTNTNLAIQKLKEAGFWIIGTSDKAKHLYTDDIYNQPIAIIIGSEGSGIKPSVAKHCDYLVKIPMQGKVSSLNASVAAGVILFEAVRQRNQSRN